MEFFYAKDVKNKEVFDYDLHKKAAQAIALASANGEPCFLLSFGIPGTGKSEFPYNLAYNMNHSMNTPFSLMYAKCDELLRRIISGEASVANVTHVLESKIKLAFQNTPSIVAFDEIDSFTAAISGSDTIASTLTRWMRGYAKEAPPRTLTIGTTNWPIAMDFSVTRRVRAHLFFDVTPNDVICKILFQQLGIQNCEAIGNAVIEQLNEDHVVPVASDIVYACEELKKRAPDPAKLPEGELCDDLVALTSGTQMESIDEYCTKYEGLINRAKKQVNYWAREFDKIKASVRNISGGDSS